MNVFLDLICSLRNDLHTYYVSCFVWSEKPVNWFSFSSAPVAAEVIQEVLVLALAS